MNIAICDDDRKCIDRINTLLEKYIEKEKIIIYPYMSGEELLSEIKDSLIPDIVFLDIEMLKISGIDVARKLKKIKEDIIIIFMTSHLNYVSDTFRLGAFQFLVKPVDEKIFECDFERAIKKYKDLHKFYNVRWRDKNVYIEYRDIIYIEGYNRHLFICTEAEKYECVGNLNREEDKLVSYGYVRCHRGFLVNMNKIKEINKAEIVLKNEVIIPISRNYREGLMETFNLFIAGKII